MPILTAIQYRPRFATCQADVSDNFRRCGPLVNEAAALGTEVIVFPELALSGYFLKDLVPEVALRIDSLEILHLIELSYLIPTPQYFYPCTT